MLNRAISILERELDFLKTTTHNSNLIASLELSINLLRQHNDRDLEDMQQDHIASDMLRKI